MLARLTPAGKLIGGAAIAVVIAAFLPWVSIFGISALGIEGDGVITLVAAIVGLVALAAHAAGKLGRKPHLIVSGIMAVICALIGLADMNGAAAIGLYVTLFAGIAWVIGVVWDLRTERAPVVPAAG